jgi:hypothetical protein
VPLLPQKLGLPQKLAFLAKIWNSSIQSWLSRVKLKATMGKAECEHFFASPRAGVQWI